ncbi:MAG: ATP-binding protein [Polyangiaceae bacterium]|nr:ATP-binding protein [Polyangiaceae bacterium]
MNEFIGREREIRALNEAYAAARSAFIPIYGRRRVGKSELILHWLREKRGVYFLGKKGSAAIQIREFLAEAAVVQNEPLLAMLQTNDWKVAIEAVMDRSKGQKLVLVFDEFQWTAEASPELPSVLQALWDRRFRDRNEVVLILCGSYVGFMEREVLGKKSPLFGRRTAQILLAPFEHREAALFHPSLSVVDKAKIFFLCGGVPLYLRRFSRAASVEMNISTNLLDDLGPLYYEPEFLLREELREVESYYAVLLAMAMGARTAAEIAKQSGIGDRSLQYYFKQLMDLGYVRRRYPLTGEGRPPARYVRYELDDALLRFWFRFIYPNMSFIQQMGGSRALKDRLRPHLDAYFGTCFERLCRQALPILYEQDGVSAAFEIGEYWDKTTQIDVVGVRDDGWTDIAECKWGPVRSWKALEDELEAKVAAYPNRRNATIGRRIFTQVAAPAEVVRSSRVRWHSLQDLYQSAPTTPRVTKKRLRVR